MKCLSSTHKHSHIVNSLKLIVKKSAIHRRKRAGMAYTDGFDFT